MGYGYSRFWFVAGLLAVGMMSLACQKAFAEVIFQDGFESGDLLHTENGFSWSNPNSTGVAVVRDDGYVVSGSNAPEGPFPERRYENAPDSNGRHALGFRYKAGASSREKRFAIGGTYPELWISYWVRVPDNYSHGTLGSPSNQKWFALWTDGYSQHGEGPTVVFNYWEEATGSRSTVSVHNIDGYKSNHRESFSGFIRVPEDRGRWMHIVSQYKMASTPTAQDGIVRWWRRWEHETEYTTLADLNDVPLWPPDHTPGWAEGYVMGWVNAPYAQDTEFLWDDFTLSTTSLLDRDASPAPPSNVRAE